MPHGGHRADVIRRVRGISGTVAFTQDLRIRFDYASALPWVRQTTTTHGQALVATAGPDAIVRERAGAHPRRPVARRHLRRRPERDGRSAAHVVPLAPGAAGAPDADVALQETREWWTTWAGGIEYSGPYREAVVRSLLVLRALTHEATGGIVAAVTTSLPENFGGVRNWDYRYVWLRDASLTLEALIDHGVLHAAHEWRRWLVRAMAGDPADVQIMYGIAGERDLPERVIATLPGYDGAAPVRIGNGAVVQYQADVIGEVMVALEAARIAGLDETEFSWPLQRALLAFVEANIDRPDNGIWEVRGEPRLFTHSRVMIWAAFDRGVRAVARLRPRGSCRTVDRAARPDEGRDRRARRRPRTRPLRAGLRLTGGRRLAAPAPRGRILRAATTRGCWPPSPRSSATSCTTVCFTGTAPTTSVDGLPRRRASVPRLLVLARRAVRHAAGAARMRRH